MNLSREDEHRVRSKSVEKIRKIIIREFQKELEARDKQLELVQKRINQAQKTLHVLRYVIVSSYYNNANNVLAVKDEEQQTTPARVHPAIKKLLTGFKTETTPTTKTRRRFEKLPTPTPSPSISESDVSLSSTNSLPVKIKQESEPRPSPLAASPLLRVDVENGNSRSRTKKNYVVVVGNISKRVQNESLQDKSTHKWMVYVRGPKNNPNIDHFVQKVVFHLHPSYKPNDVVEVKRYPFHLTRRGWGEFPLRVRIYFVHGSNKPVDIVHELKLDKLHTGRQTLGNETIVNLQLYTNENPTRSETIVKDPNPETKSLEHDYCHLNKIKREDTIVDLDHPYCSKNGILPKPNHVEQPENALIYGLEYENTKNTQTTIIEESVTEDIDVMKSSPKLVVKSVIFSAGKRKLPMKQTPNKRQRLCESLDANKFKLQVTRQRYKNVLQVLPFLFKHLPLVTKLAQNHTYKCTYPYVAANLQEYSGWNIGRRRSSEWFRAKTVLDIVKYNQIPDYTSWTTKKIIMYGRAHGYTPLASYTIFKGTCPDYKYDFVPNGEKIKYLPPVPTNNELIDITHNTKAKSEKTLRVTKLIDLNLQKASAYIKHEVLDSGIILKPEEIMPGVLFNAAERVLLQGVLCLAEDLIRKARAKLVLQGNFKEESSVITLEQICDVLGSRPEFGFLLETDGG